jgi:hypothetical protein
MGGGGEIGGLRQINTWRQVPLLEIFKKNRHLGFGVFIDIWALGKKTSTNTNVANQTPPFWSGKQSTNPLISSQDLPSVR